MALTDNTDLFASVDEDGINLVARHVMRQRPSLFNYGTAWVAALPSRRLCQPVDAAPDVTSRNNPLLTVMDPIAIPLTNNAYALDFCLQITQAQVDLHPADVVALPPELSPLPDQRLAVHGRACGALGCPSARALATLPPPPKERPAQPTVIHPDDDAMTCFCLDFFAVAGAAISGTGDLEVSATLDRVELVDLAPAELESNLECFLEVLIVLGLLPNLRVGVRTLLLDILAQLPGLALSVPGPPGVPHDPAIEDDRFKLFLNLEVSS
jgi:hypothetical protein